MSDESVRPRASDRDSSSAPGDYERLGEGAVDRRLVLAEFALWVGVLVTALVALATVVGLVAGGPTAGGLGVAKTVLFVVGFLLFGLGALELRPDPAWKDDTRFSLSRSESSRYDLLVARLPPLSGRLIPVDLRVGRGAKWFAAGVLVLAVSYLMEVLGAGVGA